MPLLTPTEELRLLSKVSKLYYDEGLTQDEIVTRLQLSRAKVSRLLKEARERGIVKISVLSPPEIHADLEVQLESRYRLREAIVVEVGEHASKDTIARELGIISASYLQRIVQDGDVIGVSWGTTLNHMVTAMQPYPVPNAHIVQIIGGLGPPESEVHATDLSRRLARMLNCKLSLLPVPGIVDSVDIKKTFLLESHVQRTMNLFPILKLAIVGIGAPTPDSVVLKDSSILSQNEMEMLLRQGAVGDIALHYFDEYGNPIITDIDERVIGIGLDQLKKIERVIGVAGGVEKVKVIRGALLGGYINVLITDQITARSLLDIPASSKNQNA